MANPKSINENLTQITEQICATMAALVQEAKQQFRQTLLEQTDNPLQNQAQPKQLQKLDDVDRDFEEEENRQLQIRQEDDRVIYEVGDHKELLAKIEDPSLTVIQVCTKSIHDKVVSVSHSDFSSPSLSASSAIGKIGTIEKKFHAANKVFDIMPERDGYIVCLNPKPPDAYNSHGPFQPAPAALTTSVGRWMANTSSMLHPTIYGGSISLSDPNNADPEHLLKGIHIANKVFDERASKNNISWNVFIAGYNQKEGCVCIMTNQHQPKYNDSGGGTGIPWLEGFHVTPSTFNHTTPSKIPLWHYHINMCFSQQPIEIRNGEVPKQVTSQKRNSIRNGFICHHTREPIHSKIQIRAERYHTFLDNGSAVYSCGSSLCGVLGRCPETKQCVTVTRISFPSLAQVTQVSAFHNHAAFVKQSGEIFTCGDNSSFYCGHRDTNRPIFRPRLVETLEGVPCKQVAAGLSFTVFLSKKSHVYTCGTNAHGQLGHEDTPDSPNPKIVQLIKCVSSVVQVVAGPSYVLSITEDGIVHSFGSGTNFCLSHSEQHNELQQHAIQSFRRKGINIFKVSAGDEHVVAFDSRGYMLISDRGERESALTKFVRKIFEDFELLIKIILDGPVHSSDEESDPALTQHWTFRSKLVAFDAAWCSYLNSFVVWKVKDAESLEEDLMTACQLKLSRIHKCKLTPERDSATLTHDLKTIQKQVTEDQKLLREKVLHLSGGVGIQRMENAFANTRTKYFQAMENGSPVESPITHVFSPSMPSRSFSAHPSSVSGSVEKDFVIEKAEKPSRVIRSLFKADDLISLKEVAFFAFIEGLYVENELIVNEAVHEPRHIFAYSSNATEKGQKGIKAKLREAMEKALWDGVTESLKQDEPKYARVIEPMREVRDELCDMAPQIGKQEITNAINLEVLLHVLNSGKLDIDYLGKILEFALVTLQKLSAAAQEDELKEHSHNLLKKLAALCNAGYGSNNSYVLVLVKGLCFVLEQIQALKKEISKARIRIMEPLLKGPTGLNYLGKAFIKCYGLPCDALTALPLTAQWFSSVSVNRDPVWDDHTNNLSELRSRHEDMSQRLLPSTTLRTGGSFSVRTYGSHVTSSPSNATPILLVFVPLDGEKNLDAYFLVFIEHFHLEDKVDFEGMAML